MFSDNDSTVDVMIVQEGLKLIRTLGAVEPLAHIVEAMTSPPPSVQSDADLIK